MEIELKQGGESGIIKRCLKSNRYKMIIALIINYIVIYTSS